MVGRVSRFGSFAQTFEMRSFARASFRKRLRVASSARLPAGSNLIATLRSTRPLQKAQGAAKGRPPATDFILRHRISKNSVFPVFSQEYAHARFSWKRVSGLQTVSTTW